MALRMVSKRAVESGVRRTSTSSGVSEWKGPSNKHYLCTGHTRGDGVGDVDSVGGVMGTGTAETESRRFTLDK